jgi:polyisoprenoid-binding protein YceI
VTRTVPLDIV